MTTSRALPSTLDPTYPTIPHIPASLTGGVPVHAPPERPQQWAACDRPMAMPCRRRTVELDVRRRQGMAIGRSHAAHCCGRSGGAWTGTPPVRLAGMCGIVGYVGSNVDGRALEVVMEGLARLEYRGYDSAGVALVTGDHVVTAKRAGKLANLKRALAQEPLPESSTGIGHTRWATHGGPTDVNAHPHRGGKDGKLALIHNGIIENFHTLK